MIAYDPDVGLPIAPSVSNKGCATTADINFYPSVIKLICDTRDSNEPIRHFDSDHFFVHAFFTQKSFHCF